MRLRTLASLGLCAALSPGCNRSQPSTPPEPQTARGPGTDSCAVYVQRVAEGVRCTEVDASHCSCELIAAAGPASAEPPLLSNPGPAAGDGGAVTPPQPAPTAANATLVFAPGPANTIVICRSGPCPVATAELITVPYPQIAAAPSGTALQLEFHAAGYMPYIGNYTLYPGTNQIAFKLEASRPPVPDSAMIRFDGAPPGATVQCVSGPCPDTKTYPIDGFPPVKLARDDQTLLLRFTAPGYRTATSGYQVSRGAIVLPVVMERSVNGR